MIEQTWRDISVPFLFGRTLYGIEIDTVSVSISMGSGAHGGSFMSLEAQHKLLWSDFLLSVVHTYGQDVYPSVKHQFTNEKSWPNPLDDANTRRLCTSRTFVGSVLGFILIFFNDLECFGIPHPYIFRSTIPFGSIMLS